LSGSEKHQRGRTELLFQFTSPAVGRGRRTALTAVSSTLFFG
jgi:hypothetical protein